MRKFWTILKVFPLSLFAVCLAGCPEAPRHNPELAGKRAAEFAETAFVRRDFDKAHALLAESARRYISTDKFQETITRLHPDGYPATVTATGTKPMMEEKAIYVYVSGENSGRHFQYT
ncbi:MAG TPA: hypothetical protein VGA73_17560, partial [Candidatus Binatia bacterium]